MCPFLRAAKGHGSLAISYQLSAISYQLSAISYQLSAVSAGAHACVSMIPLLPSALCLLLPYD